MKSEPHFARRTAAVHAQRVLEGIRVKLRDRLERRLLHAHFPDALDGKRPHLGVRRHEGDEIQAALRVDQTGRMHGVQLLAPALEGVILHRDHALAENGVEQPSCDLVGVRALALRMFVLRRDGARQPVQELLHGGRQHCFELVECARDVLSHRRPGEAFDQRAAEIQRGQFRQRQAGAGQRAHRPRIQSPELGSVDDLVVHGKSRHLKRLQIPSNRARADRQVSRELRNRLASRRGNPLQNRPLSNQFAVASHMSAPDVSIAQNLIDPDRRRRLLHRLQAFGEARLSGAVSADDEREAGTGAIVVYTNGIYQQEPP